LTAASKVMNLLVLLTVLAVPLLPSLPLLLLLLFLLVATAKHVLIPAVLPIAVRMESWQAIADALMTKLASARSVKQVAMTSLAPFNAMRPFADALTAKTLPAQKIAMWKVAITTMTRQRIADALSALIRSVLPTVTPVARIKTKLSRADASKLNASARSVLVIAIPMLALMRSMQSIAIARNIIVDLSTLPWMVVGTKDE
jgi:hypothetical protein